MKKKLMILFKLKISHQFVQQSRRTQSSQSRSTPHSFEGSCRKDHCVYTKGDYETKKNKRPSTITSINFKSYFEILNWKDIKILQKFTRLMLFLFVCLYHYIGQEHTEKLIICSYSKKTKKANLRFL